MYTVNGFVGTLNECLEYAARLDLMEIDYKIEKV